MQRQMCQQSANSNRSLVTEYAAKYGMQDYVELLLAVMMQESGGLLPDVMQAAEGGFNTRYPHVPNGIPDPEYSIECGVQELKRHWSLPDARSYRYGTYQTGTAGL